MFKWIKKGLIHVPAGDGSWRHSHGQLPTAFLLDDEGTCRVYYAGRTPAQRSHIGWFDVRLNEPDLAVTAQSPDAILEPGEPGFFDEHGVYPASVVRTPSGVRMYFIGWNQGAEAPMFYAAIGLAESIDGGRTFKRAFRAPILARSEHDPCLVTSPNVFFDDGKGIWRMTYVSGVAWKRGTDDKLKSLYHIKSAESQDGIAWDRKGDIAVDFSGPDETNVARSAVIRLADGFHMWFCYIDQRIGRYRMGYASSSDGRQWTRRDDAAGLPPSQDGFDSEMVCYPSVVRYQDKLFMFYNGNNFGAGGVGLAVAQIPAELQ